MRAIRENRPRDAKIFDGIFTLQSRAVFVTQPSKCGANHAGKVN
jgi:hypothetical protein